MNPTIQHFLDQIRKGQYKAAAQIYFNRAYQYQKEFNEILDVGKGFPAPNSANVKDAVMEELRNLEGYGEYNDFI
jgi:hypothetical protein